MQKHPTLKYTTIAVLLLPQISSGLLGGFEDPDGTYWIVPSDNLPGDIQATPGSLSSRDVTRYNAGETGTNNNGPGGSVADIPDDSGLWSANSGGRLYADAFSQFNQTYAIKHPGGYNSDWALGITTDNQTGPGTPPIPDLNYSYSIDSRDLDGNDPFSIDNDIEMQLCFWLCPSNTTGTDNIFGLSFLDQEGDTGFEFGYSGTRELQFRMDNGVWTNTGVTIDRSDWSQVILDFDFANDTIGMQFNGTGGAFGDFTLATSAMGADMKNLTQLDWNLKGGTGKNFFDEFNFKGVPEPSTALLVALAFPGLLKRKR